MSLPKEECANISQVLEETQKAILTKDPNKLKDLSNQTTHSACSYQDIGSITTAVLVYALSKLVERKDYNKIKNWEKFVKKFNSILSLSENAVKTGNQQKFETYITQARQLFENYSIEIKPYIQEIMKKASINKAFKLYEHGLSLERTAKILGISQWELSNYIGHKHQHETKQDQTINVKERAKMAMEFFQ